MSGVSHAVQHKAEANRTFDGKKNSRRQAPMFSGLLPSMRIPDAEVDRLDLLDRNLRRAARREGRTQPLSKGLPIRQRDTSSPDMTAESPPKRRRLRQTTTEVS